MEVPKSFPIVGRIDWTEIYISGQAPATSLAARISGIIGHAPGDRGESMGVWESVMIGELLAQSLLFL
jgi:hypothetical protein